MCYYIIIKTTKGNNDMTTFTATFLNGTTAIRNSKTKNYKAAYSYENIVGEIEYGFSKDELSAEKAARSFGHAGIHECQGTQRNPKIVIVGHRPYEITTNIEVA